MRRHAGVVVASLVAKASRQHMLTRLRRQVRMENELPGIHAELLLGRKLEGILTARREVNCSHIQTGSFHHRQASRDQRLL